MLIYSDYGTRIAILDLRREHVVGGRMINPLRLEGHISSLPLVEGDYRVGFFVGTEDYEADYLDLARINVVSRPAAGGPVPYPAAHRGCVELTFELRNPTTGAASNAA
jgi:hypothetical protein